MLSSSRLSAAAAQRARAFLSATAAPDFCHDLSRLPSLLPLLPWRQFTSKQPLHAANLADKAQETSAPASASTSESASASASASVSASGSAPAPVSAPSFATAPSSTSALDFPDFVMADDALRNALHSVTLCAIRESNLIAARFASIVSAALISATAEVWVHVCGSLMRNDIAHQKISHYLQNENHFFYYFHQKNHFLWTRVLRTAITIRFLQLKQSIFGSSISKQLLFS
jgi:hypothetical protein